MKIEQIYTSCLAQGAYYIESDGEVAIIDPLREVQSYLDKAEQNKSKIKYIFETHFHADFVSGHVTLSELTNAPIVFGPNANPTFDCIIAKNQQVFKLGKITIKVLHTPGHTMESTCYLLQDENGKDHALFSGDTLFLGDVGRPDLAQKSNEVTQEDLAGILFDSLREKIMILADEVIVYPAHGAGSACGKNLSKETIGTIGEQKQSNYALRSDMTKKEFIKEVTDGLLPPPAYFPMNVKLNKEGYQNVANIVQNAKAISVDELETIAEETNALLLDVRHQDDFSSGHIPNSIFIGLDGGFAPWVGALLTDVYQPIILIATIGREKEAITRLSRVGYDATLGYVNGGFEAWKNAKKEIATLKSVTAEDFENIYTSDLPIFDVRKTGEFTAEHLKTANSTPLDFLNNHLAKFPTQSTFYLHCAGGYRSVMAASILKARGFHNSIDIKGGYGELKNTTIPKTNFVCPSTI
jgi:glyoxylase-like metal-dependent hydrolase (beta-lactamase superfamily II)/rhodanese-related sulfurtransferase